MPLSEKTLDRDVLAVFCDGDGRLSSFARLLIHQYVQEAESQVAALNDAAEAQSVETLKMISHSLKGSSKTVGAMRLGALCEEVEYGVEQHTDRAATRALVDAIRQEFEGVRTALEKL